MDEKYNNYFQFLKDRVFTYKGRFDAYLFYTPDFFRILCRLLDETCLEDKERHMILCALGYFVTPNDVIPEEIYGPAGYIDDIYLCCFVLKKLAEKHGMELIEKYWEEENEDFSRALEHSLSSAEKSLGEKTAQVLNYVGL
jgi:uncharacterized membrane protein YkvA (DUF1232 family)